MQKVLNFTIFAVKNLWSHRLRAFITIGSVSIGIAAITFLVSLGFGIERLVMLQVSDFESFRVVDIPAANLKTGKINEETLARIKNVTHVTEAYPSVDAAGRVRLESKNSTTETVIMAGQNEYFRLSGVVVKTGRMPNEGADGEVVISTMLANLLGFKDNANLLLNESVILSLIVPKELQAESVTGESIVKDNIPLKVVGITEDDQNAVIYATLGMAAKQGIANSSTIKIKVDDRENVATVRKDIENIGFSTEYIGDTMDQIAQVFSLFRLTLGGLGFIALIIAALGAFNTLTISLMERIREIGLLKTFGVKRREIFFLFIAEALIIGTMGGVIGVLLGNGVGLGINAFLQVLATRSHSDPVSIFYAPPIFNLYMIVGAIIIGFITGLYPAYRAIKSSALNIFRYE